MDNSAFVGLVQAMRQEGAARNPPQMQLATVRSASPLTLYAGGAELSRRLYAPPGLVLAPGDRVALQRVGEDNLILSRLEEVGP